MWRITFIVWLCCSGWAHAAQSALPQRLLDSNWLQEHLHLRSLRIVDARSSVEFAKAHIPGAVNLPVQNTFGPNPRSDLVAPISQIQHLLGQAGINNDIDVVVYDDGTFIDAARLIWILESHGHERVALLNGGMPEWRVKQFAVSDRAIPVAASEFVPTINPDRIASTLATRLAVKLPNRQLLDVRSEDEYLGYESSSKRYGHIPGAQNVSWDKNFSTDENGISRIRPLSELRDLYADLDPNLAVITYCNKGKQSALTHFVLRELGYQVSAYDGSWYEWGNNPKLPIHNPSLDNAAD